MLREAERDVNEADTVARKAAYSLEYHTKRLKRGELSNDWHEHAWKQDQAARTELDQAKARLVWLRAELAELNRSHIHLHSARMNGHDPYAYLKDVLTRLLTHKASQMGYNKQSCHQPPF